MEFSVCWLILFPIISGYQSFGRAQNVGESDVITTHHCGNSLSINCANHEMMNVVSANYGRTSRIICPREKETRDCILDSSLRVVRNRCQGQSACEISASDFRTDPCPDVSKYIEVNYTCETKASASCGSANTCDKTTEVCVDINVGIVCECAENYQRGKGGNCQALTCENSATTCNTFTQRCKNLHPGIQCVCAEGYIEYNSHSVTCENSATTCNAITERCEDLNPGIQCVCAEEHVKDSINHCIAMTCENSATSCNVITQRCEDLHPGIQCACAEGYVEDKNNQCIVVTCENSATNCNAVTERCEDLNPGIHCVCEEGYTQDHNNECIAVTCENSVSICNIDTQLCKNLNPGIQCVCADGYMEDHNNQCIARTCENSATTCDAVTQLCQDLNPGIECVCAEGYRRVCNNSCIAVTCENSATNCNAITERCEDLNLGIHCVCEEGYTQDNNNECIAVTCENSASICNIDTQLCKDLNPGIQCVCADGYMEDHNNQCIARTCENSATTCDAVTELCKDLNPGFQCVCAEGYRIGSNNSCIAVTCENSATTCNEVTERCEDLTPGIHCVCAEGYTKDNDNECIARTCENSATNCDAVTQLCQDLNPGIQCVCAEGYRRVCNNSCIAMTCENSVTTCNEVTERCEDLTPGIHCVCAEGYTKDNDNECIALTCENSASICNIVTQLCKDLNPGIQCVCAEGYIEDYNNQCIARTCENFATICDAVTELCQDLTSGVQCVCAEGYTEDNNTQCIAMTCENRGTTCNAITQRCKDLYPGIECVCAEGYMENNNSQCIALTCENSCRDCNSVTERCKDLNPGIQCVCAERYKEDNNDQCIAVTCETSASTCNAVTERCKNLNPGIQCVCAEGYMEDHNNQCIARTCENLATTCDAVTQLCQDLNPGIECVCAEGYTEDNNTQCIAMTCGNSATTCNTVTERCENLNPGIQCVCAEGHMEDNNNQCIAVTCENSATTCNAVTERCEDLNPGIRCICLEGYTKATNKECVEIKKIDSTTKVPENGIRCPTDIINIGGVALSFPSAETGEEVNSNETCNMLLSQNQRQPLATRVCNEVWQEPRLQNCFDVDTPENQLNVLLQLNLTNANVREFSKSFALLTLRIDDITARLLELIIEYLAQIVAVGSASFEVTDVVVSIVSIIMKINEEILDEARGVATVIALGEKQITNVHRNGQNYSQSLQNLNASALKVQRSAFEYDFTFIDHVTDITESTLDEALVLETLITIPYSVVELIDKVHPNVTAVPISFVTYEDSRLFRKDKSQVSENANGTQEYIGSHVISSTVELPGVTISNLPQNSSVIIKFSNLMIHEKDNDTVMELLCVYWKYTSESGEGEWSQAGCRKLSSGFEDVTCSCDHLTSFALLVRTYDEEETGFQLALQLISTIGCIISIVGLFLSLMCMVIIRQVRIKQQTRVHFNLCLALLGLYLSFLFGIGQAKQPEICRRMTSLIYFFCLSSMAWMSVEAFYIYKLIWKCKRNNIKRLIPVGILFAWGMPGIASMVIYFLDTHNYTAEPDYCFLHPGHVLLYGFILELLILFLYNSIVFVLVTYRITCRKIEVWNREYRRRERIIRLKSTVLFWLLLGISWIFGFLATFEQPASIVFQIIFCVLLSLQGFFMFYMLIVQNPEMKRSLSSVSFLRSQSASLQLGARSTSGISSKKQMIQGSSASFDRINNQSYV